MATHTPTPRKIKWDFQGEAGYWESLERRFSIDPYGFNGRETPEYYRLTDNVTQSSTLLYTVRDAKKAAQTILEKVKSNDTE